MKERDFQATVVQYATLRNWKVYHPYDSRRSAPGFPDLTLARDGRLLFLELKVGRNQPTPAQTQWLAALDAAPCATARVIRPADWPWIEEALQ